MKTPDPAPRPAGAPLAQHATSPSGESFPVRLAAIDVGSNAIRMRAAEFSDPDRYRVLVSDRGAVRLAQQASRAGEIAPAVMGAAVDTLARFRRRIEKLGVVRYRAVATSAVRESANGKQFVDQVRREAGIELEAISGEEEAALVHRAVRSRVALEGREWVLVDVGGGSTEVVHLEGGGVLRSESHPIGAVRLLKELPPAERDLERSRRLLAERTGGLTLPGTPPGNASPEMIAMGGNIEALARLAGYRAKAGVATLTLGELRGLIDMLASLSFRERVEQLGLREDRADVILPAALLYEHLAKRVGADAILVPWVGVREGVLLELAALIARQKDTPPGPSSGPPR